MQNQVWPEAKYRFSANTITNSMLKVYFFCPFFKTLV